MTLLSVFYIIGIVFGIIFLFLNGSTFFGLDSDSDVYIDSDVGFNFFGEALTLKSLINFLTFFGWIGVFCVGQGYSLVLTFIVSTGVSMVLTILLALVMFLFKKLQATPKDVDSEDLLYKSATVYLVIPGGDKMGKIQISVRGALRTIDAISETGEKLNTNSQVIVTEFIKDNLVKVATTK